MRQNEVAAGHWELTLLDIQITGKALFFKTVGQQQHDVRCDFREVPAGLTPAEAVEMLTQKRPLLTCRASPHSSLRGLRWGRVLICRTTPGLLSF